MVLCCFVVVSQFKCMIFRVITCSSLLRWKNTKEKITNHKGTRMLKDGED